MFSQDLKAEKDFYLIAQASLRAAYTTVGEGNVPFGGQS